LVVKWSSEAKSRAIGRQVVVKFSDAKVATKNAKSIEERHWQPW
jgi:hypothetical protein